MTANIHEPNIYRQASRNRFQTKDTRQKPLAFRWWEPDCVACTAPNAPSGCDDGCTGEEPPLENSWAQPAAPLEPFGFRLHADGSLEFKGHLDASAASTATVAVTLPGANVGEVDFRPPLDQYWHTTIVEAGGTQFTLALVFIDSTTGEVTISWPAV